MQRIGRIGAGEIRLNLLDLLHPHSILDGGHGA